MRIPLLNTQSGVETRCGKLLSPCAAKRVVACLFDNIPHAINERPLDKNAQNTISELYHVLLHPLPRFTWIFLSNYPITFETDTRVICCSACCCCCLQASSNISPSNRLLYQLLSNRIFYRLEVCECNAIVLPPRHSMLIQILNDGIPKSTNIKLRSFRTRMRAACATTVLRCRSTSMRNFTGQRMKIIL